MVDKVIAFAICAGNASMFASIGFFASRRHIWAYIVGKVLYLLAGIIYLLIGDLLSAGFHAFVLFQLFNGCKAARALNIETLTPIQPIVVADVEPNA